MSAEIHINEYKTSSLGIGMHEFHPIFEKGQIGGVAYRVNCQTKATSTADMIGSIFMRQGESKGSEV